MRLRPASRRPVEAPEVRADVIFDRILESGPANFGSMQGINQMLGRLYSAREDVNTLSTAYDEIGARLDVGVNELEVEAVNKESSTTKPKDLDAALELAGMTRDQMIPTHQRMRKSTPRSSLPSPQF